MILPERLKKGDTIGVIAPSDPIIGENIEELEQARKIVEKRGGVSYNLGKVVSFMSIYWIILFMD